MERSLKQRLFSFFMYSTYIYTTLSQRKMSSDMEMTEDERVSLFLSGKMLL